MFQKTKKQTNKQTNNMLVHIVHEAEDQSKS